MTDKDLNQIKTEIEQSNRPKNFPIKLVAIDGRGGAGKSTLAKNISKKIKAGIIAMDDFDSTLDSGKKRPDFLIQIKAIQKGAKTLNYPRASRWPGHNPKPVKGKKVKQVMILDGISYARKDFRPYLSYVIWVETSKNICLKRGLERDGNDALKRWKTWQTEEEAYIKIQKPQSHADIIVNGED